MCHSIIVYIYIVREMKKRRSRVVQNRKNLKYLHEDFHSKSFNKSVFAFWFLWLKTFAPQDWPEIIQHGVFCFQHTTKSLSTNQKYWKCLSAASRTLFRKLANEQNKFLYFCTTLTLLPLRYVLCWWSEINY